MPDQFDLLVIGGGVNGCGVARDAAGRGLSTLLVEAGDLAGAASSASSKLAHGGLRYLEQGRLRLVREALAERAALLACAPHLVERLPFVLPHDAAIRSAAALRVGLVAYDLLAGRRGLGRSRTIRFAATEFGAPLLPDYRDGFVYWDCRVDDSRLVVLTALDARERGAEILTRVRLVAARRVQGLWRAELEAEDGRRRRVSCRAVVNAAGPWAEEVLTTRLDARPRARLRLVKGSHLVFPRLYEGDHAYVLQHPDRRVVFAIPFCQRFTLVGTTDEAFRGDPRRAAIEPEEAAYLCSTVNRYFARPVAPSDARWSFSGVRPLHDDGAPSNARTSRDYALALDLAEGAPLLSIYGGKITTYRRLAERVVTMLARWLPHARGPWTQGAALPGGDLPQGLAVFTASLRREWPFLGHEAAARLARAYGARAPRILGSARAMRDLGCEFGFGLTEAELDYLRAEEWARTAEDVLWRRSKLGLFLESAAQEALRRRFDSAPASPGARAANALDEDGAGLEG